MNDTNQILLTSMLTIIGGVIIFVVGRIIERFIIDPVAKQREAIGDVADHLIFYANLYSNPHNNMTDMDKIGEWKEAGEKTRKLASILNSRTFQVPYYWIIEKVRCVRPKKDIEEACSLLIGLSNSFIRPVYLGIGHEQGVTNSDNADKIRKLLSII